MSSNIKLEKRVANLDKNNVLLYANCMFIRKMIYLTSKEESQPSTWSICS